MNTYLDRLAAWNTRMNDVPRRVLLIIFVTFVCFLAVRLFPYFWPFALAMVFASMLEPIARLLRRALKGLKAARIIATLACMVLFFGLVTVLVFIIGDKALHEGINLARSLPDIARVIVNRLREWVTALYADYSHLLPQDFLSTVNGMLNNLLSSVTSAAATVATRAASITINTATSLPIILLSIVFTIMGTFYFSYDRERIAAYFKNLLPSQVMNNFRLIKSGVFSALFGQVKAQIFISFVLTLVIIAGLYIMGKPYALLLGILLGVGDVLPVIGAGLFLNSWAIVALVMGDYYTAVGMLVLYLVVLTIRQIIEPRIVGKQLGLYPLVTMASMFAGFQLIGALGLIAGPLVANICRVTLDTDAGKLRAPQPATPFKKIWQMLWSKRQKKK